MTEHHEPERLAVGCMVRVPAKIISRYTTAWRSKLDGRTGIVEKVFTRLGASKPLARVRWLKRGNRGKEFEEVMNLNELERLPVGWTFPPHGRPVPPTAAQLAQDQRAELEALGDALF
jgi:hypothetical protein